MGNNKGTEATTKSLDLILCPPAPHPTPPIDSWNTTNYTSLFNLLDLPAGILPVRPLLPEDLRGELPQGPSEPPLNGWDQINRELWNKGDRGVWLGGMLSVQVVAPKLMERRLVQGMRVLEGVLGTLGREREKEEGM